MGHEHHNHNQIEYSNINWSFKLGIFLNIIYVAIEVFFGIILNSTSLLSDAGHNFSDIISLIIGGVSTFLLSQKAGKRLTYGFRKTTVIAALFNAILLIGALGIILFESIKKLFYPQIIDADVISLVAFIGIIINSFTAFLFIKWTKHDINLKAVFFHMLVDALVSLGVVIGAILMKFTHWYWLDGAIGIIISLTIFFSTFGLLKESFLLSIDAVPQNIDIEKIKAIISSHKDVESVHHIHLWALSTTETALTAHIVVKQNFDLKKIMQINSELQNLLEANAIHHTTFEFELASEGCPKQRECT